MLCYSMYISLAIIVMEKKKFLTTRRLNLNLVAAASNVIEYQIGSVCRIDENEI